MLDSMFQEGTDKVLDDRVARPVAEPPTRQSSGRSVWNTLTAVSRGSMVANIETGAFGADVLGAFGEVQAGYGLQADPSLLFSPEAQRQRRKAGTQAREQLDSGEAFSTAAGDTLRATAKTMMPDPQTSNAAENLLFGLGRFATKAVTYSLAAGPGAGAALLAADEGMTEAARLKEQGVDFETRTKVGVVAGAVAGLSVALPVAGRTTAQTVGLVAAGGPGGFIAQQATTRAILQNADYDKIADQYDPFDPVALAVSTLVPAGFGAFAMRGVRSASAPVADSAAARQLTQLSGTELRALRYDDPRFDAYAVTAAQREGIPPEALLAIKNVGERSANSNVVSPAGARGLMQFMPETWAKYGKGRDTADIVSARQADITDPIASIDAAAAFMKDLIKQYDGDVRAAIAHYNGGGRAGAAVRAGKAAPAAETRAYLERTDRFIAERTGEAAGRAAANDPEAVAAARVQQVRDVVDSWNLKDPADVVAAQEHLSAVMRAADQLGAGERVDVSQSFDLDTAASARMLDEMVTRLESARADLLPEAGNVAEPGAIRTMRQELDQLRRDMPDATEESIKARAKELQAEGDRISYKQALSAARKEIGTRTDEMQSRIDALERQIETNRSSEIARQDMQRLEQQIDAMRTERAALDQPPSAPRATAVAARQAVGKAAQEARPAGETAPAAAPEQATAHTTADTEAGPAAPQQTLAPSSVASSLDAQTAEIARLSPDLMVQLEGMDKPMRLSEALEAVKAEADAEVRDAPLFEVAAQCFLRSMA